MRSRLRVEMRIGWRPWTILIALAICAPLSGQESDLRTWTDDSGQFSVEARLIEVDGDDVVLQDRNSQRIRVPRSRLSQADLSFLDQDPKPESPPGVTAAVEVSGEANWEEPFDVIVFSDVEDQQPLFVTLEFRGRAVIDGTRYGKFRLDAMEDDQQKPLQLLVPLKGPFEEDLQNELADLDHFFLESPDRFKAVLILERPSDNAQTVSISGSFQLEWQETHIVDDILDQLDRPLDRPDLVQLGSFTVSRPSEEESDVEGSLRVDFVGDTDKLDDVELLDGSGQQISTGGFSERDDRKSQIVRWTGEPLPNDTKLRVIPAGQSQLQTIDFRLDALEIPQNEEREQRAQPRPPMEKNVPAKPTASKDASPVSEQMVRLDAGNNELNLGASFNASSNSGREAFDGDPTTRWTSDPGDLKQAWLATRWDRPVTVKKIVVRQANNNVIDFVMERFDEAENDWVPFLNVFGKRRMSSFSTEGAEFGWGYFKDAVLVNDVRLEDHDAFVIGEDGSEAHPVFTLDLPRAIETSGVRYRVKRAARGDRQQLTMDELEIYGTPNDR